MWPANPPWKAYFLGTPLTKRQQKKNEALWKKKAPLEAMSKDKWSYNKSLRGTS
jgi:hypothetical protein